MWLAITNPQFKGSSITAKAWLIDHIITAVNDSLESSLFTLLAIVVVHLCFHVLKLDGRVCPLYWFSLSILNRSSRGEPLFIPPKGTCPSSPSFTTTPTFIRPGSQGRKRISYLAHHLPLHPTKHFFAWGSPFKMCGGGKELELTK